MNQTVEYLKELTAIASPTGFTEEVAAYLVKTLTDMGYSPVRTAKGGVTARPMWIRLERLYGQLSQMAVSNWIASGASLGT